MPNTVLERNYSSIPTLQWCNVCEWLNTFIPHFIMHAITLSMLGFKLIRVSKRGPCCEIPQHWVSDMKTHMVSITVAPFLLLFFLGVTQASAGALITMMGPTQWEWGWQKNLRVVVADKLVPNESQNTCQLDFDNPCGILTYVTDT